MLNNRFSGFLLLLGVTCSPLALADSFSVSSDVCQACTAGNGAYGTLAAQQQACQQCQAQEQPVAAAAAQIAPPVATPPVSTFHWASRFYLGIGGGWSRPSTSGQNIIDVSPPPPDVYEMADTVNSYMYGGDIGMAYRLGSAWIPTGYLSAETWEIGSFDDNITHSYADNTPTNVYSGKINTEVFTVLFNASFDIYRWYGLSPYVGGGIGWAEASLGSFTENLVSSGTGQPTPFSYAANNNQLFVYDVVGGLHYQMGNNWQLQLNYIWLPIGNLKTGIGNTGLTSTPALSERLVSNNVILAVHYIF